MPKTPPIELNNSTYDKLKPVVQLVLPGIGTLYFALAAIWGLPYAEEVIGTIAAIATFLGVVLGISTKNYKKHHGDDLLSSRGEDGTFVIDTTDPEKEAFTLQLDYHPSELWNKDKIVFNVRDDSQPNNGL